MTFLLRSRLVRCRRSFARWQLSEACPNGTRSAGAPSSFSSVEATGCTASGPSQQHSTPPPPKRQTTSRQIKMSIPECVQLGITTMCFPPQRDVWVALERRTREAVAHHCAAFFHVQWAHFPLLHEKRHSTRAVLLQHVAPKHASHSQRFQRRRFRSLPIHKLYSQEAESISLCRGVLLNGSLISATSFQEDNDDGRQESQTFCLMRCGRTWYKAFSASLKSLL